MASFGPWRPDESGLFEILKIVPILSGFQKRYSLPSTPKGYAATRARNQNLPLLDGHYLRLKVNVLVV